MDLGNAPPPSTLAAQLVENISVTASARSARPDEAEELLRFCQIIEHVKNTPSAIENAEEHIRHNQMLVYVLARVTLDSLRLEDTSTSKAQLRSIINHAVQFLRVIIKESPAVLMTTAAPGVFLFMGPEPLWVWILPRILRLVSYKQDSDLVAPIQLLLADIYAAASHHPLLWPLIPRLLQYLKLNVQALSPSLRNEILSIGANQPNFQLQLPPDAFFGVVEVDQNQVDTARKRCTYAVNLSAAQASDYSTVFLSLMLLPLSKSQVRQSILPLYRETIPWLLDACLEILSVSDTIAQTAFVVAAQESILSLLKLRSAALLDTAVVVKANVTLVLICVHVTRHLWSAFALHVHTERVRAFCMALAQITESCLIHEDLSKLVQSQLLPEVEHRFPNRVFDDETSRDIFTCCEILRTVVIRDTSDSTYRVALLGELMDRSIKDRFDGVNFQRSDTIPSPVQAKKHKALPELQGLGIIRNQLHSLLGVADEPNPPSLGNIIKDRFTTMGEVNMCALIDLLGYACCACDDTLRIPEATKNVFHLSGFHCTRCGDVTALDAVNSEADFATKEAVADIFLWILQVPEFAESRQPRLHAMVSLRRIATHFRAPRFLDLESSAAAQWCLKSLQSSIRELRVCSGRTLPIFLASAGSDAAKITSKNRANVLSILRSLSESNQAHLIETCIMAWSQVGSVVSDEQLNLVLVKLMEYLGHQSAMASATAITEILRLASARHVEARDMFAPFWRNLAYYVVKDLDVKPKLPGLVAEIMEMSVDDFLLYTQSHSLPWLILTQKKAVIQRIAAARGESEPWQVCLDPANLGPILALLLMQDVEDVADHSMKLLRSLSPHFDALTFVEMVRIEPVPTVLELLKAAGDAEESRKSHIRNALQLMGNMFMTTPGSAKQKKNSSLGRFLQQHALGLMTRLTDVINESKAPLQERHRYIRAMAEMLRNGKHYTRVARPQISACLLAAMSHDDLRAAAFSCWAAMIFHMEEEDIEALVETTFFLITHYWPTFDEDSQQLAKTVIGTLFDRERQILEVVIGKLPSLSHIPGLADAERRLNELRQPVDTRTAFSLLSERISHENSGVTLQALSELASYLQNQQSYLQIAASSEQPDSVVAALVRALLDCAARYNGSNTEITSLCTQCIGLIGCLDPNRVESLRGERHIVVRNNFENSVETTDFVLFMLEEVLVKAFLSATDTRLQGFLSYVMQELLERCDIGNAVRLTGTREAEPIYRKFLAMSETTREVLTPFLTSRYRLPPMAHAKADYPIFRPGKMYGNWLRAITLDILRNPQNPFAGLIFDPLCRVIKVKDLSIAEFLLPYVILHVIISEDSTEEMRANVLKELQNVLGHEISDDASYADREDKKLYCEAVFRVLDYAMRWLQGKRAQQNQSPTDVAAMNRVQILLDAIPAELISQRAVDCKAYSRALFHLEQHIRQVDEEKRTEDEERNRLLQRLQDIYTQIDEPDGLEGLSAQLQVIDIDQQVLSHRKAGRWAAAQTWYEIKLAENPDNVDVQIDLLTCLKESGQHDVLLNYVEGIERHTAISTVNRILPFAVEASWATTRWESLQKFTAKYQGDRTENFNVCVAQALLHLQKGKKKEFLDEMKALRERVGSSLTFSTTTSLQACHEPMLNAHVLADLELIAGASGEHGQHVQDTVKTLDRRLAVLGSYVNDKQYLLGIRRAAMELMRPRFTDVDISALWLSSARLARKAGSLHQSFNAVLHASQLGDGSATIEHARLLWKEGHPRKAIQTLQGAITNKSFSSFSFSDYDSTEKNIEAQQNMLAARAHLLLAKWLDNAGQTHASALRQQYQNVPKNYSTWEKGHYYLGRHYKKVLESEKALKPDDQSDEYLTGETAKLVIENYIRALHCGTKYLYQTLPRILTLWLELGAQVDKAPEGKVSLSRELHHRRKTQLEALHKYLWRYSQRIPAYIFYTALPQIVARIAHSNTDVFKLLEAIILKVVEAHPRQALWSLFAIMTTKQATSERRARGQQILLKLRSTKKAEEGSYDVKTLLRMGEKLADQLLMACNNGDFQSNRTTMASITRDLNFNHKCTPCPLVVPIETCLTATLPTLTDNVRKHKAFSRDVITIDCFLDEVLVLGSLAKPRKLTARGSNGVNYGLLIKPKDDLRTDQRLMEFNGMINRSLKRDAESSRRQLYIRTYAVTPLNEECGIIEWVDGLKTLRDILLNIYRSKGIAPNYGHLAALMKDACTSDKNTRIFTEGVLGTFPAVLPQWFISQFPNPTAWFSARLRYTRSCAVMSMVGTILGLGDRHGENVLLEEGNGGIFHVDFNCLFDKGLTFAQPERVPFRLTHNMVAAMGIYGYEGPFRKCSELTLSILRQQEETLMTILEAFIYDPTLDLQKDKKRKNEVVRLNPQSVVESIKRKVRGLLPDESIPLGVEGQVDELIKQAVNPKNLAAMYIGWCPFL
ncbi:phosphatidylinositol 3 [Microdochium trichocladiopsis]|uniref:Serine/threonine-protein kinase MEC1 n=1 Tax=Microdochium trichocladiopsis TaxID=1682393 RepID=A0A9P8YD55_9PEZI|nr:phosphatidylinositol 3 [Microdochium trichocladiopsis]KAH7037280.1 phosphatidylinositol 3 [Microdochium trichocladiopsis]